MEITPGWERRGSLGAAPAVRQPFG
jgi:hypothetical protein